jgi:acetoin utilization deacetylase AcuC-like enzyme
MRSFTGTLPQAVRQRLAAFSSFPALAETSRPTRHHAVGSLPPDGPDLLLPLDVLSATRVLYATVPAAMHDYPGHAECAARVPAILAALESSGLTSQPNIVELTGFQRATPADVAPVHNPRYIAGLERASEQAADVSSILVDSAPTYLTQTTYNDALAACGAAMSLVDHVIAATGVKGGRIAGFGICRPPGHHAIPNTAMGLYVLFFCIVFARPIL